MQQNKVTIYTDGACKNNPGPGGYAAILQLPSSEIIQLSGFEINTTNNRMELMGAIKGLEKAIELRYDNVAVYTDSTYLKSGITVWMAKWISNNWYNAKKQPVKNQDLWECLSAMNAKLTVEWFWVKAHNGHEFNEMADQVAKQAILKCLITR